ncbi:GAF domain-containing protein [bacterium]|nr:GAF domain-containing protein [bacterium]
MTPSLLERLPVIKWLSILALIVFVVFGSWVISPYQSFWFFIKENLGQVSGYALLVVLILYVSFSLIEFFVAKNIRLNRWLEEVYRVTREVQAQENEDRLIKQVLDNILDVFDFDRAIFFLDAGRVSRSAAPGAGVSDAGPPAAGKLPVRTYIGFPRGHLESSAIDFAKPSEIGRAVLDGQPRVFKNFGDVALEREVLIGGEEEGGAPDLFVLIPLRREGVTIGVLYVDRIRRRRGRRMRIEREEVSLLGTYMDQVAVVMERLRLLNKEKELSKTLTVKVEEAVSRERELEEKLRLSETLAALGEMAASLTHEIKNPLGGLDMYARLLLEDISDPGVKDEEKKELAGKIIEGVKVLNGIVGNLLGYARVARGEMGDRLSISDVVMAASDFARAEIQRVGVQFKCDIPPDLTAVGNFDQLRQVFLNLLLNGVQAMLETGGTLSVRAAIRESRSGGIGSPPRVWVVTEISDTGVGMTETQKSRIFEDFYTTREKGTGLGLAISRKIVKVHGGEITVESEWKKGSTFRVYLPAVPGGKDVRLPDEETSDVKAPQK